MSNICVIHSKYCKESGYNLALDLKATCLGSWPGDLTKYDLVFNYGVSSPIKSKKILNSPEAVSICVNKISTFKRVEKECKTLSWTRDKEKALKWAWEDGIVVVRERQEGNQGDGLFICENFEEFEKVKKPNFYTRYFFHDREFRIDIFKGKVLAIYEKKRDRQGFWDFVICKINGIPSDLEDMVEAITKNIKIDFCGIDVLVNAQGEGCLLEVNSGPILHEETAKILVPLIIKELKNE